MRILKSTIWGCILGLSCSMAQPLWPGRPEDKRTPPGSSFIDATDAYGLNIHSPTFGAVVADMDGDGHEDLIISQHNQPPLLLLYRNGVYVDRSEILPDQVISDWHGVTAVDLDNDGDKDLAIAGGGSDGVGPGLPNRLFRNNLTENGRLGFDDLSVETGIEYQPWRTRVFLPLASPDGSRVDLYMVGLPREGCPNIDFSHRSGKSIVLKPDPSLGLNQSFGTEGLDTFLDYDRDGDQDLIILKQFVPTFFERRPEGYVQNDEMFKNLGGSVHVSAGDLNNDGYPDLYFSHYPPYVGSDNFSFNDHEIHFVLQKQAGDAEDEFQFETSDSVVEFDFSQHTPANPVTDSSDIFVGRYKWHPPDRYFSLSAAEAEGRPVMDRWGTYVWRDAGTNRWHAAWVYGSNPGPYKGRVMASSLRALERLASFELQPPARADDVIMINQKGTGFKKLDIRLTQFTRTRTTAMVDVNNDGRLDIVGIRGSEQGRPNGEPFVLINQGQLQFTFHEVMSNPEDDLFQADMLVWGFFDSDGRPDFFFTNGNGLNPDNDGPFKLFLNTTQPENDFVILKLKGTAANREAIGAQVELSARPNILLGYRQVGMGFDRCQSTLSLHFGLGQVGEIPLTARILWPGATEWDERPVVKNRVNDIIQ